MTRLSWKIPALAALLCLFAAGCGAEPTAQPPEASVVPVSQPETAVPTEPPTEAPSDTPSPVPPTVTPTPLPPTDTPTHTPSPVPPTATDTPTPVPPSATPVPPTATRPPATATKKPQPTAVPTQPPGQAMPANQGCYLFQNFLGAEVKVTFTAQDWAWSDSFVLQPNGENLYCFDPGRYTYTLDAPPPWGSTNGELTVQAGDRYLFPIQGRQ